ADFVEGVDRVMEAQWRRVWPSIRDFTIRIDEARGAVQGDEAWVAAPWDMLGVRADGTTFPRPGRLTIAFARRAGRWLAVHTHFLLTTSYSRVNPSRTPGRARDAHRRLHVQHRLRDPDRGAGPHGRGAPLRVPLRPRAHAHPREPPHAVPQRRRAAARVRSHARSLRRAGPRRGGHDPDPARHGDLPDHRAGHDHGRQGGRQRGLRVERALPVRDRRGLERRGDGAPRDRPQDALQATRRAGARHEADLDEGGGRVSREVRELRPDLDVAEARAEAPPADPPRRREWPHAAAGRGLLRRLVPPRARGRRDLHGARGPQGARGPRGARHEDDLRLRLRRQARGGRARPARGGRRDARNSQVAVGAARPGAAAPGSVRQARPVSLDLPAWAAELLHESRVARLGTADHAGRPLVVPVCYAFDGRACFSAIDAKPKRVAGRDLRRVRNIEQNPHVSLVVDRYDEDWSRLAWVIVEGRAAVVTEGCVRALAVALLRAECAQL